MKNLIVLIVLIVNTWIVISGKYKNFILKVKVEVEIKRNKKFPISK